MSRTLSEILSIGSLMRKQQPPKRINPTDWYNDRCKAFLKELQNHIDDGRLFISYSRHRSNKYKGVAVAFFIDGQLYAGCSACLQTGTAPCTSDFAQASHILSTIFGLPVSWRTIRGAYRGTKRHPDDAWRSPIGKRKAVVAARPVPAELAAKLTEEVNMRINELWCVRTLYTTRAVAAKIVSDFALGAAWFVGDDKKKPLVPYCVAGSVAVVIMHATNAKNNYAAKQLEEAKNKALPQAGAVV